MNDIRRKRQTLLLFMLYCVYLSFSDMEPNNSILSCTYDLSIIGSIKQCGSKFKTTYWESPTRNSCNITLTCITKDNIEIPLDAFNHLPPQTDFDSLKITIENCNINEEFITQFKRALLLPSWHEIKDFEIYLIANDENTSLWLQNKSLLNFCPCYYYGISYVNIFGLQTRVIPDCVERLNISNCRLETLPQGTFSSNGKLINLAMEHNKLFNLPDYIFQNLTNLKMLSLARNQLSVLSSNLFIGLHSLGDLILSDNNITRLPPDVFKPLVNLWSLNLDNNPIVTISERSFTSLHTLIHLELSFCGLRVFNTTTMPIDKFVKLDISNNNISGLKYLNLHHPSVKLYLSNNNISTTNNFSHYVNTSTLRSLHMRNCGIRHISNDFLQGAKYLIELDLAENYVLVLPERFLQDSRYLKKLLLDFNKIAELSNAVFRGKPLRILSLSGNRLTDIGAYMLQSQTYLVSLNLSHNQISKVHPKAFRDTSLIELDLSYNILTTNEEDSFQPKRFILDIDWRGISKLDLSHNNISIFGTSRLVKSSLKELILNNNGLRELDQIYLFNLESLSLASNKLDGTTLYNFVKVTRLLQNINLSNCGLKTVDKFLQSLKYLQMIDMTLNEIEILFPKDFLYSSKKLNIDVSNNDVATIVLEDKEVKEEIEYQDRCSDVQLKITTSSMNCDCYIINVLRFYENDITLRHSLDVFVANISESHITCERPTALEDGSFEDVES